MNEWAFKASHGRPLPVRREACADCAVICGFYSDIAADLAGEPPEIVRAVSERWDCHESLGREACRGNWDYQGLPA